MMASLPLQLPMNPIAASLWQPPAGMSAETSLPRRVRLLNISPKLHCSIIGTCLSLGELRAFARKTGLCADPAADDHHLHSLVVFAAGHDERVAKLLHKALDRKFAAPLRRYDRAATAAAVEEMWRDDLARGEIPGAYWAVTTHPHTDQTLLSRVFSDIHMLSHLVGASNRADIRRLQSIEQENADLRDRLAHQRRQAAETLAARDREIAELRSRPNVAPVESGKSGPDDADILSRHLAREIRRRERSERAAAKLAGTFDAMKVELQDALRDAEDARAVCRSLERRIETWLDNRDRDGRSIAAKRPVVPSPLRNRRLLFVGGKPSQIHHLRQMVTAAGAIFLSHDGGIEENSGLLAGQVAAAAMVLFPVDCISHDAALRIKRLCRHNGKPFLPLRTFSLASVSRILDTMTEAEPHHTGGDDFPGKWEMLAGLREGGTESHV